MASAASELAGRISITIINPLILLLFALALFFFLWGLVAFVWQSDSDEGRQKGIRHMLWGILGMFVMVSAFGIIKVIQGTFNL